MFEIPSGVITRIGYTPTARSPVGSTRKDAPPIALLLGPERREGRRQRGLDPRALAEIPPDQGQGERPALLRAARLKIGNHGLRRHRRAVAEDP